MARDDNEASGPTPLWIGTEELLAQLTAEEASHMPQHQSYSSTIAPTDDGRKASCKAPAFCGTQPPRRCCAIKSILVEPSCHMLPLYKGLGFLKVYKKVHGLVTSGILH